MATIDDAQEIGMGTPTFGTQHLSDGQTFEDCNPSLVWSSDSRYLAVPQGIRDRKQRHLIIAEIAWVIS